MCGGIVGALSLGVSNPSNNKLRLFSRLLTYNSGRILSYTLSGAIAGMIGAEISKLSPSTDLPIGPLIAAAFMILLGMYLANWWRILSILERLGFVIWKRIEPWGRRWLPVKNPWHAFGLGIVWGWLPCGLVYAVIAWSLTTGDIQQGALLMLGFGLGTLPMLLLMGATMARFNQFIQHQYVRTFSGMMIIAFGIYTGISGFSHHEHKHAQNSFNSTLAHLQWSSMS